MNDQTLDGIHKRLNALERHAGILNQERICPLCQKPVGEAWLWTSENIYYHFKCWTGLHASTKPILKHTRDINSKPPFEFTLHCHECLQAIQGDYIEPSPGKWYHPDCWVVNESSSRDLEQARADLDKAMADNIECNTRIGQMQKEITARDHTIERCGKRTAELEENNQKQIQAKLDACKRAEDAEKLAVGYREQAEALKRDVRNKDRQLAELGAAMAREKQTAWHNEVKSLADELKAASEYPDSCPRQIMAHRLRSASILLNDLWRCYTHKANMVPRDLRIKELETQLKSFREWVDTKL